MRKGGGSRTAQFVALNRALGNLAPQVAAFSDPIAERLVQPRWAKKIARARAGLPKSPLPFWMRGMGLFNQFRTVVLDRALLAAMPVEQLVILGAGLDGRAWRLGDLKDTTVFEVDHPLTQALKTERAVGLTSLARAVRFVPLDFGRDELSLELPRAGFDPGKKTFWLLEGVTMYLTPAQVRKTLVDVARLSAPGSQLALTYMAQRKRSLSARAVLLAFGLMTGEPMRSMFTPEAFDALARGAGWATISNTGIADWKHQLAPDLTLTQRQVGMQWYERIWVGRRDGTASA
jgi:methyltransferase (TIGR00027 family)